MDDLWDQLDKYAAIMALQDPMQNKLAARAIAQALVTRKAIGESFGR
jgi:hypothetical protein